MREILFRGKRIDNGKWIEGNLFVSDTDGRTHILVGTRRFTIEWEVYQETIGQFTGLTDKNGKRIFEGDILRLGGDELPYWYEEGMIVAVSYVCDGFIPLCEYDSDCGTCVDSSKCEVIGNIHDNPDLLEVHND